MTTTKSGEANDTLKPTQAETHAEIELRTALASLVREVKTTAAVKRGIMGTGVSVALRNAEALLARAAR